MEVNVRILNGPLPPMDEWNPPGAGAVVKFSGLVRPLENEKPIKGLFYEAYQPMAQRQIEKISRLLIAEHKLLGMRIEHSVGFVGVGACSFHLQIASSHRPEALAAMAEFIDRLKHDVPIWKEPR